MQQDKKLKSLPIGESDIASMLNGSCVYIDKTRQVYDLVSIRGKYFLSRPRRFGKSTLISTFYEIFKGNKELFKDQWIYNSDLSWDEYPIIRIDFNGAKDSNLVNYIKNQLNSIAIDYQVSEQLNINQFEYHEYFRALLKILTQKYQRQVVVLIDEYDKPILDVIEDVKLAEQKRDILKGFYGVMKGADECLRFVFLTGVTRFSKVGVFSGLNNLDDISMDAKYFDLCGITQIELEQYFMDYIDILANNNDLSRDECLAEIKKWYNGFYFSTNLSNSVYNPFSTLLLFKHQDFTNYWFSSGNPSFLIQLIKKEEDIELIEFDNIELSISGFDSFEIDNLNITAILYQTGYLTIKGYDKKNMLYTLGYTNYEIEKSFKESIFAGYAKKNDIANSMIGKLMRSFKSNNMDEVLYYLKQYFLNLSYDIVINKEKTFQNIVYILFDVLGFYIKTEYHTNLGRIDAVVLIDNNVYVFEFKKDKSANDAINQIHEKGYYKKFLNTNKDIYLIGMNYNTKNREIDDYKVEQLNLY